MKTEEKVKVNEVELESLGAGDHFVLSNEVVDGPCLYTACSVIKNDIGICCYYYNYKHAKSGWFYSDTKVIPVNILPESRIVWERKYT